MARRGRRSLPIAVATTVLGVGSLSACGSSTRPTSVAAPSTRPQPARSSVTTAVPADLSYLTAWGATPAAWAANHSPDPNHPGSFWPLLPDGRDTYTHLVVTSGRVTGYQLALYPAMSWAGARDRLANDFPLDSQAGPPRLQPGCEQWTESGPTVRAASPTGALVELSSRSAHFDPASVTTITVSPGPAPSAPLPAC